MMSHFVHIYCGCVGFIIQRRFLIKMTCRVCFPSHRCDWLYWIYASDPDMSSSTALIMTVVLVSLHVPQLCESSTAKLLNHPFTILITARGSPFYWHRLYILTSNDPYKHLLYLVALRNSWSHTYNTFLFRLLLIIDFACCCAVLACNVYKNSSSEGFLL